MSTSMVVELASHETMATAAVLKLLSGELVPPGFPILWLGIPGSPKEIPPWNQYETFAAHFLRRVLGYPQQTLELWAAIRHGIEQGDVKGLENLHSALDFIVSERTGCLLSGAVLARRFSPLAKPEAELSKDFEAAFALMLTLKEKVLNGWATLEDLEDQFAQAFPLSTNELEQLAEKYSPPPEWYLEEFTRPF